jgi:hypothetical protein
MIENNLVMYPKEWSFMSITDSLRRSVKGLFSEADDSNYQFASFDRDRNDVHIST